MAGNIAGAIELSNSRRYRRRRYTFLMSRQSRLQQLLDARAGGRQVDLARMIGRSPAVVWQYLSGHREMGEQLARHIERKLSLPKGWMDETDMSVRDDPTPIRTLSTLLDNVVARISGDGECAIDDAVSLIDLYLHETDATRRAKLGGLLDDLAASAPPNHYRTKDQGRLLSAHGCDQK